MLLRAVCRTMQCSVAYDSWPWAKLKCSLKLTWGLDNTSGSLSASCKVDTGMQYLQTTIEICWQLHLIGTTFVVGNRDLILIFTLSCGCPTHKNDNTYVVFKFFMNVAPFLFYPTPNYNSFWGGNDGNTKCTTWCNNLEKETNTRNLSTAKISCKLS